MFRTHTQDMTRALVAEHQATLHHEARQHRSVRRTRRARRGRLATGTFPRPRLAGASLQQPLLV